MKSFSYLAGGPRLKRSDLSDAARDVIALIFALGFVCSVSAVFFFAFFLLIFVEV